MTSTPPGRNDPCPCGSGRKYKRCCGARDAVAEPGGSTAGVIRLHGRGHRLPREVRAAAAQESAWAAEALPLMVRIGSGEGARPVLLLVTAGDLVVHHDPRQRVGGELADVAGALEEAVAAAGSAVGVLPETLRVRHSGLAEALAPLLAPRGVTVEAGPAPALEAAARSALEHMVGSDDWPPACRTESWAAWDLPLALVGELFAAAAAFYRRAPWRSVQDFQAPRVVGPSGREWTCSVLGGADEAYGIALYEYEEDLFEPTTGPADDGSYVQLRGGMISILFQSAALAGPAAVREARRHGWEVAGPGAWPVLLTMNTPGGGVARSELEDLVALFRAMPEFIEAHHGDLVREARTGEPIGLLAWTHRESRTDFRYESEIAPSDAAGVESSSLMSDDFRGQIQDTILEVSRELGDDADRATFVEAVNARLQENMESYNERSQPELGGLSPVQVRRLLDADWDDPGGPIRLRSDLGLERLEGSEILANARIILQLAIERDGLGATQKGNLKLEVVRTLIDRWTTDDDMFHFIVDRGTRVTEQDLGPLHRLRIVCELAGLLRKRSGRFLPTRKARDLVDPARAGELYALLFRTFFRKYNIDYGRYTDWPELQTQAAFTLRCLPRAAADWATADQLLPRVVLPYALDRAPDRGTSWSDMTGLELGSRLLDPLVGFDLLERRRPEEPLRIREERFRATPLLSAFLEFEA